jgi:hypothetical protein
MEKEELPQGGNQSLFTIYSFFNLLLVLIGIGLLIMCIVLLFLEILGPVIPMVMGIFGLSYGLMGVLSRAGRHRKRILTTLLLFHGLTVIPVGSLLAVSFFGDDLHEALRLFFLSDRPFTEHEKLGFQIGCGITSFVQLMCMVFSMCYRSTFEGDTMRATFINQEKEGTYSLNA